MMMMRRWWWWWETYEAILNKEIKKKKIIMWVPVTWAWCILGLQIEERAFKYGG
jgi:hypothetical protein